MTPQTPYPRPEQSTTGLFPNIHDSITERISKLEQRILTPAVGSHDWSPTFVVPVGATLFPVAGDNLLVRVAKLEQRLLTPEVGDRNQFSPFPKTFANLLPETNDTPEIRIAKLEQRVP